MDESNTEGAANAHMHQSSVEDLIARFESPERDIWQKPDLVISTLGELSGKTVMDIGCGSGYFAVRLVAAGAKVICADVNDEMQVHVAERARTEGISEARLATRKVPYDSPGLADREADVVLIVNTYHHIENRRAYFIQVLNGIKPGGELVVIDFFKRDLPIGPPVRMKLSEQEVDAELRAAGFSDTRVDTTALPYQYILRARP